MEIQIIVNFRFLRANINLCVEIGTLNKLCISLLNEKLFPIKNRNSFFTRFFNERDLS